MNANAIYTGRDIDELITFVELAEASALSEIAAFGFAATDGEDGDGYEEAWRAWNMERLTFHSGIIS